MKTCEKCHKTNRDEAKFCRFCGEKITVADEIRIKFVCREGDIAAVLQKIREVHPYEEPAIDVVPQIGWKELIPSL